MTLKEAREAKGYSQSYVATRLNVTQGAVAKWESGKNPPLNKYRKPILRLYGVKESEIDELNGPRKKRANARES